jgi:hypothetical protein
MNIKIPSGFNCPVFVAALKDALDWVPELKHEGLVCTHLSSALRKLGHQSVREVTVAPRRYDMQVGSDFLEAKYHFEGDLIDVLASLQPGSNYIYKPNGWNSAPKSIHDELNRAAPSWFLWMICVRDPHSTEGYIYPKLRGKFASRSGSTNFQTAIDKTEDILRNQIGPAFNLKLKHPTTTTYFALPTIKGNHSALVSELFYFS